MTRWINHSLAAVLAAATLSWAGAATALPFTVSIDTSGLGVSSFAVAFDFIDGGPPANSVSVSNFAPMARLARRRPRVT